MVDTRVAVLLRGVNVGRAKRIAMADFAALLTDLGLDRVRTLLNSGNAVGTTHLDPEALAAGVAATIEERLGFSCDVVVRTQAELEDVVRHDPLAAVATDPSRYLVAFLSAAPDPEAVRRLHALDVGTEQWDLTGRELYTWLPDGVTDSALFTHLARGVLGVPWTSRNRTTVSRVLAAM